MNKKEKNIIAYVMNLPASVVPSIKSYQKQTGKKYRIMLIWDSKIPMSSKTTGYDILVTCDFSKPNRIAEALLPHQEELLAISCRSEASISRFAKVIPHVPYLRTPNSESLIWATDKYEMRRRFNLYDPKCTPKFTRIKENTKEERARVRAKIGFRDELHQLSCDIDHSLNDILVRIPAKTVIPKKCKGFAAAMKWFATKEGRIIEMKGIKKIEQLESFHKIAVNKKVGDRAVFARNGGRSIFNVFLYNSDRSHLLADIRRLEQLVKIKVGK